MGSPHRLPYDRSIARHASAHLQLNRDLSLGRLSHGNDRRDTGSILAGPTISARGFAPDAEIFEEVRPALEKALLDATAAGVRDVYELQQIIRRQVGSWVGRKIRRRPMILPTVIEA